VLRAQINKTDRNDARGIAQMMRVGLYRPVHVKTLRSQKLRAGIAYILEQLRIQGIFRKPTLLIAEHDQMSVSPCLGLCLEFEWAKSIDHCS
jgi:hypothetical protein